MSDEVVEFDIDTVTVEEAELLEETLGIPWMDCIGAKSGMAKVMRGFVWLYKRRTDPDLKFEDVQFKIQRFGQELGIPEPGDEPDPLEVSEDSENLSTSSSTSSTDSNRGKSNGSPSSNSSDVVPASSR